MNIILSTLLFAQIYPYQPATDFGNYLIQREEARDMRIDNWAKGVRTWWTVRDEYYARVKARHQRPRQRWRLPSLKQPAFFDPVEHKKYSSYYDWVGTDSWKWFQEQKRIEREIEDMQRYAAEMRRQKAYEFGAMWNKMSWLEKEKYKKLSPEQRIEYRWRKMDPRYDHARALERQAAKFYRTRPDLIPLAGRNGLAPLPKIWD